MVSFGSGTEILCALATSASVRIAAFELRSHECQEPTLLTHAIPVTEPSTRHNEVEPRRPSFVECRHRRNLRTGLNVASLKPLTTVTGMGGWPQALMA